MSDLLNRKEDSLPYDYEPYETVNFCGNTLINTRFIIEVGSAHPLLIGRSSVPYVWLFARVAENNSEWNPVVERNTSLSPAIKVTANRMKVSIWFPGGIMLQISHYDSTSVTVDTIDLRPLGINMFGKGTKLMVGTNTLSGNVVSGGQAFLALK